LAGVAQKPLSPALSPRFAAGRGSQRWWWCQDAPFWAEWKPELELIQTANLPLGGTDASADGKTKGPLPRGGIVSSSSAAADWIAKFSPRSFTPHLRVDGQRTVARQGERK